MLKKYIIFLFLATLITVSCGKKNKPDLKSEIKAPEGYVYFSGYLWKCADDNDESDETAGGMDDFCQPSKKNVSVDSLGNLVLEIKKIGKTWYGARVSIDTSYGFGYYTLEVESSPGQLDKNTQLRFFTVNMDDSFDEITTQSGVKYAFDAETGSRVQYYAYSTLSKVPYDHYCDRKFNNMGNLTNKITIFENYYSFELLNNNSRLDYMKVSVNKSDDDLFEYAKTSDNNTVVINFCLPQANAPSDGKNQKIIIKKFNFTPINNSGLAFN